MCADEPPAWLPASWQPLLPTNAAQREACVRSLQALGESLPAPRQTLAQRIDDSRFGVSAWLSALGQLGCWLRAQGRQASALEQLDFIHAATAIKEAELGWSLSDLVAELCDNYDFGEASGGD
ncbi:MAG: hypothetical protein EA402_04370 [Planctomycetota bacterium]|nr:MAG: hypothetical protein EA402_04370 [Planctomycetota bacterium]